MALSEAENAVLQDLLKRSGQAAKPSNVNALKKEDRYALFQKLRAHADNDGAQLGFNDAKELCDIVDADPATAVATIGPALAARGFAMDKLKKATGIISEHLASLGHTDKLSE
jgi:hypothetical protein